MTGCLNGGTDRVGDRPRHWFDPDCTRDDDCAVLRPVAERIDEPPAP
jgi:hypothetical protein